MHRSGFILAALLLSSQASAATIFKCVDEAGRVTFTKNANCPRNSGLDDVISAHNAAPSGSSDPVQMASPVANKAQATQSKDKEVTVVGLPQQRTLPVDDGRERETPIRRPVNGKPNFGQPCVKVVDKNVSSRRVNKDGSTTGRGQIIKVVVPC